MKSNATKKKPHIVLFVEGDTDKIFLERLLQFYKTNSSTQVNSYEIQNLNGVTRYTSKVSGKLENELIPNARRKGLEIIAVCCSYDTDVFMTSTQPIVDWAKVQREIKRLRIREFSLIPVENSIEDWFLEDINGVCEYLKISPITVSGIKSGNDKLMYLFKKANKIYIKGISCHGLIQSLDIRKIRLARISALQDLERLLNVCI